jgi:hypothetical protein
VNEVEKKRLKCERRRKFKNENRVQISPIKYQVSME